MAKSASKSLPYLGYGVGLRPDHYDEFLENLPKIDWLEILTENYLVPGGKPLSYLHRISEHYPVVMHGVSLSIGSTDPLDMEYLRQVKALAKDIEPVWISDHLCWTSLDHNNLHDLLPLPYTEEAIDHVSSRIQQVQDYLGRQILLENVSSYLTYKESTMQEWEFLMQICEQADCLILLDINNIYVSAINHGFDPLQYLNKIDIDTVQQFHLAGHSDLGNHIIDTHDHPVADSVWSLYAHAVRRFGRVSTMIERDAHIPPLSDLLAEVSKAHSIAEDILTSKQQHAPKTASISL